MICSLMKQLSHPHFVLFDAYPEGRYEFAQKLKALGKASKVVIVACMHKLLVIMNAVVRSGHAFSRTYAQDMKYENIAKPA